MDKFSLYTRMHEFGTVTELPGDVPDARFALPSTVNWMRALAILSEEINFAKARTYYSSVQRRRMPEKEINTICEQLLFTLHQIASLRAMSETKNKADVARIGIVAWYYGIYGAASAMITGADGSFQETHAATAQQWDRCFSANKLVLDPFADRLSSLLDSTVKTELSPLRTRGKHSLVNVPKNFNQAWGCIAEYLSGTSDREQDAIKDRVRQTQDFKALGVNDFRSGTAKALRDKAFEKRSISFLHQAYRYRGKANYRDAIFLAYGAGVPSIVDGLISDLATVLTAFSTMAAGYVSFRIGGDYWNEFLNDLEDKRSVSVSPKSIWS